MIDKEFLNKIEDIVGYKPLFHDDYILLSTLNFNNIEMQFQFLQHNAKIFKNTDIEADIFVTVKFLEISDLTVEAYDFCNNVACIISEFTFEKRDEKYYIEIEPSCGFYMKFTAKGYEIAK
ncbi:MAG: Imm50 family immunity protein [Bacteroidota bacterium]